MRRHGAADHRFLSPLNLTNILVQSSIMAVIAIGMTFVIIGGGFDLSVGSTVALRRLHRRDDDGEVRYRRGRAGRASPPAPRSGSPTGSIIAKLGVNPFITTLGTMVLVRGARLSDHRRRAGRRRRHAAGLHRLRLRAPVRHPLSRLGAGDPARSCCPW